MLPSCQGFVASQGSPNQQVVLYGNDRRPATGNSYISATSYFLPREPRNNIKLAPVNEFFLGFNLEGVFLQFSLARLTPNRCLI